MTLSLQPRGRWAGGSGWSGDDGKEEEPLKAAGRMSQKEREHQAWGSVPGGLRPESHCSLWGGSDSLPLQPQPGTEVIVMVPSQGAPQSHSGDCAGSWIYKTALRDKSNEGSK